VVLGDYGVPIPQPDDESDEETPAMSDVGTTVLC
jgi:hypothetical protein